MLDSLFERLGVSWFHFTRALGAAMVVYGILFDHSDARGEIILTGAGMAGFDKAFRSEPKPATEDKPT